MRTAILAALSALMLIAQSAYAAAEKRVALVLGLSAYRTVPELSNPKNDASDVASKLRKLGFEVVEGYDLDHAGLTNKIREFSRAMIGADAALFYYSGHGIQANGANYLAPVDTKLAAATDIDFELVPLDLVTQQMQIAQAEKTLKVGLVFLDACRNNPLTRNLTSSSRAIGAGLAKVQEAPHGMLIAFSTQPGNVALDGLGRNSPFTKAVLANIDRPGLSVGDMLINVRTEVMKETADKQVPWENSSLTGQFYFNPANVAATSEAKQPAPEPRETKQVLTVDDSAVDLKFWESISSSSNPAMFTAYLSRFPSGNFAALAQAKLDELNQKRAIAVEAAGTEVSPSQQTSEPVQAQSTPASQETAQVATLEPAQTATAPASGSFDNAVLLQKELQRVGCYAGRLDGDWGRGSRRAMERFNAAAKEAHAVDSPSAEAINAVRAKTGEICVAVVAAPQEPVPARVTKTKVKKVAAVEKPRSIARCARGEVLADGECVKLRKRTKAVRQPSEEVIVERAPRQRVVVQPQITFHGRGGFGGNIPISIGIGF